MRQWSAISSSTYGSNLLSITKQFCREGKPTDGLRRKHHEGLKNRNNSTILLDLPSLLLSHPVVSHKCRFCVFMMTREDAWVTLWGRVGGRYIARVPPRPLVIHSYSLSSIQLFVAMIQLGKRTHWQTHKAVTYGASTFWEILSLSENNKLPSQQRWNCWI